MRKRVKTYEDLYAALLYGHTLIRRFSSFRLSLPSKPTIPHWIAKHFIEIHVVKKCRKNSEFFEDEWELAHKEFKTYKEWKRAKVKIQEAEMPENKWKSCRLRYEADGKDGLAKFNKVIKG